jgi:O-antigen/teichoic acid export membrane protein
MSRYSSLDVPEDLKVRSINSGGITLASQFVSIGITFVSVVVLARLLTPEDYGLIAMVTSITGFINLFNNLGLSSATIQKHGITDEQVSALFWINGGLGAIIMLIIASLAPAVAWFYSKPQLFPITMAFSLNALLIGLGTQHGALLTKHMHFGKLAIIHISALIAGFVVAVGLALSGWAYWALVAGSLVTSAWHTGGLWIASPFRPSLPRKTSGVSQLVRFGANVAGFDLVTYLHRNVDNILIGRVWGAQQLGLYNKAYELMMLPIRNIRWPLNKVAYPAMSKLQNDPALFRSYFIRYCSVVAFISMPIVAFFFVCSENIIRFLLGVHWLGAAELFGILALAGFIQPVASLRQTVIMSSGYAPRLFRWGLIESVVVVASFICGLPWGAKGVAIAYCIATYLILHPSLLYAFKNTPVRASDFYRAVTKPCVSSILMCILYILSISRLRDASDFFVLAISLPLCLMAYITVFYMLPGGKQSLINYWEYLNILFRRA